VEVPMRNATQKRDVVAHCRVVGKVPDAVLRSTQSAGLTFRRFAAPTLSTRARARGAVLRTSHQTLLAPQKS
jgi:hypothetical protein